MSDLRKQYLHKVVIIRDGSNADGEYGLVTHVTEADTVILTVTFFVMQGVRHDNYYSPADVELTDKEWQENLPRDPQVRCILDKHYTGLWFICDTEGVHGEGSGTPGIAWAEWLKKHDDEATIALHHLVQEVTIGTSTEGLENEGTRDPNGSGKELEGITGKLEDVGSRGGHASS
jgi:hypothetical protein